MKIKRTLFCLLAAMALLLFGCGKKQEEENKKNEDDNTGGNTGDNTGGNDDIFANFRDLF